MSKTLKIIIFGTSGMVGQGVLRECLLDSQVQAVTSVGRSKFDLKMLSHATKLTQLVTQDLYHLENLSGELAGFDAVFFCLGASAAGLSEEEYAKINYDLPLSVAQFLLARNPSMSLVYVSGTGTDSSEKGDVMWARVKGKTENHLMQLPFKSAYMFRPAGIIAKNGESSKTPLYRYSYMAMMPFLFILEKLIPKYLTTTEEMGRAMLQVAKTGQGNHVVENFEIRKMGSRSL